MPKADLLKTRKRSATSCSILSCRLHSCNCEMRRSTMREMSLLRTPWVCLPVIPGGIERPFVCRIFFQAPNCPSYSTNRAFLCTVFVDLAVASVSEKLYIYIYYIYPSDCSRPTFKTPQLIKSRVINSAQEHLRWRSKINFGSMFFFALFWKVRQELCKCFNLESFK